MHHLTRPIRRALLGAVVAALAIVPASALAAQPTKFHDNFTDSFSGELCGIAVDFKVVGTDNFFLLANGTFKSTSSVRVTVTNPLNGKSVVISSAGQVTGQPIIDEQAGTITFATSFKGLPEKIQTAKGAVQLRDAGVITFSATFDLNTGEFISAQTLVRGPHPEAESDFTLFCDVITQALS